MQNLSSKFKSYNEKQKKIEFFEGVNGWIIQGGKMDFSHMCKLKQTAP